MAGIYRAFGDVLFQRLENRNPLRRLGPCAELTTSLERWLGVSLVYENAWWDKRQQAWTTKGFHIIDNFELNISRGGIGQDDLFPSTILWNQTVFESFESGYLKSIDYDLYISLEHPTARRMYRFLSKRMYHRPDWTFDLKDLALEHIGLSRNYSGNAGKIKEKLQPAIEELESVGFLEASSKEQRYVKDGKNWKIRLVRQAPTTPLPKAAEAPPLPFESLIFELTARGVHQATATELARQHTAEAVLHKIEVFDWLKAANDKRIARNPAGYLKASIAKDFAQPEGFIPAAERQRQQEAKAAKERQATEARRRKQQGEAVEQAKKQRDFAFWESPSPEQQAEYQTKADARIPKADLAKETGPLKRMGRLVRRMALIRALLDEQEDPPLIASACEELKSR